MLAGAVEGVGVDDPVVVADDDNDDTRPGQHARGDDEAVLRGELDERALLEERVHLHLQHLWAHARKAEHGRDLRRREV